MGRNSFSFSAPYSSLFNCIALDFVFVFGNGKIFIVEFVKGFVKAFSQIQVCENLIKIPFRAFVIRLIPLLNVS